MQQDRLTAKTERVDESYRVFFKVMGVFLIPPPPPQTKNKTKKNTHKQNKAKQKTQTKTHIQPRMLSSCRNVLVMNALLI